MTDLPSAVLAVTVCLYWSCVGAMSVRVRRRTRKLSGIVPSQRGEQLMWLVWLPLVAAWMVLPWLAVRSAAAPWGLPDAARQWPLLGWRWAAAALALGCLGLSIACWKRMGRNWRMAIAPDQQTELVTGGLYGRVRHPIYALSMLLMLCSVVVVPTLPVATMALIHIALMVTKALNEERFLAGRHGTQYRSYMQRTGRFLPRWRDGG